ncbi:MAG: hypothetical protein A4S12_12665 [Proteobacteria bacterium SG_bin5]|nr:pyridoxamine 5'-phosphate oxidase family protein [Sphingomonas sp.]OQW45489.1 MAG: hypothetical protein A4S12_12665 [Proteobacteria bacterium SG_bin5]
MQTPADWPNFWHPGELAVQERLGTRAAVADAIRFVRPFMPDQHRDFFAQLPFIVIGSVDPAGDAWAGMRFGEPGFAASPAPDQLVIAGAPVPGDPIEPGIAPGREIGLLGIQPHSHRRNRLNGRVRDAGGAITLDVVESFGNCPKYIQARLPDGPLAPIDPAPSESLAALDAAARAQIGAADIFFVASYVDDPGGRRVDVSHRGGRPGFVRIEADGALLVPDFVGNDFFMTLGNFELQPRAGLCFPDFTSGTMLQLTGDARLLPEGTAIADPLPGACRYWRFTPRAIVRRPGAVRLRMRLVGWSPATLATGDWQAARRAALRAEIGADWRRLRVTARVDEADDVVSFHLEAEDGRALIPPEAGQHLPIRLTLPGDDRPSLRTYSLSSPPEAGHYRLSIKRAGRFSNHVHAALAPGAIIEAKPPAGQFTIDAQALRPVVLLAGGIGITPLLAMAHHLVAEQARTGIGRATWLFQAARAPGALAFSAEIARLVAESQGLLRHVRVVDTAGEGGGYDALGRIDLALLKRHLPWDDYDFVLCGPPGFMQGLYDDLRGHGVRDARIHAEAFGPASLARRPELGDIPPPLAPIASEPVTVRFAASAKQVDWTPEAGSLLELAESIGLALPFSCRGGSCGSCAAAVSAGAWTYPSPPAFACGAGEALLCQARPAAGSGAMLIEG